MSDDRDTRDRSRWQAIDRLFEEVLDQPVEARRAYLEAACPDDPGLRQAVAKLLDAEAASEGLFETPGPGASSEFMVELAGRPQAEERLGRYTLVRELGRGGMGTVYLAREGGEGFERDVAIKVLRRGVDTDDVLRRFATERRILASLAHPNVARLYDGGATHDGRPYLVMELVDGEPITTHADRRQLTVRDRLSLILEVTDAVRAAHAALVVHRDLKPSNILVTADGHVKLLDFGIAKLLGADDPADSTKTGLFVLTPDHASPEQLRGEPVTTATDVYQLGVLLYRLLTGRSPFGTRRGSTSGAEELAARLDIPKPSTGVSAAGDSAAIAASRSTTPPQLRSALSGDLDRIISKALHAEPSRRYLSVEELSRDIHRYLEGRTISARPDTAAYRTRMYLRRHPWVAPVAVGAVAFVAIYVGTLVRHNAALEVERNAAQLEAERALEVQQFLVGLFESANPYIPADPGAGRDITVAAALDVGTERLRASLVDRPAIRASVLSAIAETYRALGLYDRALPVRKEALDLQTTLYGPNSRARRDSLRELGMVTSALGHDDTPLELFRERLALASSAESVDVDEVANARLVLGRHLISLNRTDEAQAAFDAILLSAAPDAAPSLEIAEATRGLADVHLTSQRWTEAERNAREAVALVDQVLGPDSVAAGFARGSLAQALGALGRSEEADRSFIEAIDRLEGAFGPDHKHVVDTKGNLAVMRTNTGDHDGAIALLRELVESGERVYGSPDHPQLSIRLQNLGTALLRAERLDEADTTFERVAAINRRWLGTDNHLRALPLVSLSGIRLTQGRAAAAESVAREALGILDAALPAGHFITAVADCRVARALIAQGRDAEAAPYFDRAVPPLLETTSVPEYRRECLDAAAAFREGQGDAAEAARLRAVVAGIGG